MKNGESRPMAAVATESGEGIARGLRVIEKQ
jgi:hypothetical protein